VRSSWINPDLEYEAALERFVVESLKNKAFTDDVARTMQRLGPLGLLVGLSQALVKVASPGVPDYYQGSELWDFSLVDPDNRRPVDYTLRKKLLAKGGKSLSDGQAKLFVIRKGLELRKKYPTLFHGGEYLPLHAGEHVCAFALRGGGKTVVAVAPRLFARLEGWGESRLPIPDGKYINVLTGARCEARDGVTLAELLGEFPVALLESA